MRVALVDDEPLARRRLRDLLLARDGVDVVGEAADGAAGIALCSERKPDLVLLDIAMPGMDGIETTRRLRALPRPPHVLILTSLSPSGTVERAIEAGAEGFVSKTDAPEEIIRRITDVCDLPLLSDIDTGFGPSAFNIARTVKSLIKAGAAA